MRGGASPSTSFPSETKEQRHYVYSIVFYVTEATRFIPGPYCCVVFLPVFRCQHSCLYSGANILACIQVPTFLPVFRCQHSCLYSGVNILACIQVPTFLPVFRCQHSCLSLGANILACLQVPLLFCCVGDVLENWTGWRGGGGGFDRPAHSVFCKNGFLF